MIDLIFNMLMIFLLITAFFMVFTKDILTSVITLPIFGAILVVIFVILQAPGPAIAEAVIASGLTTFFFVITINKTEYEQNE
ncbi:putative monovalent cation/H+ antiporter subunit B [Paraliobacillus sp. PM-2]|uniref:Na(+)/H(+) antiporter subunit B n=1 Tax=Paraliobacillus sp. PM-2 TaxID=1462524 RepID=UPI00061C12C0|nr:hydrogenase subunit MbhD domain-containing protein [Paraliobacillus sp. PM-2]CQR48037.1 putative monovalent cation/H+ antiporter subunit B [Paraliobacillus sp. PM-2]